jgi:hypothetical protein
MIIHEAYNPNSFYTYYWENICSQHFSGKAMRTKMFTTLLLLQHYISVVNPALTV